MKRLRLRAGGSAPWRPGRRDPRTAGLEARRNKPALPSPRAEPASSSGRTKHACFGLFTAIYVRQEFARRGSAGGASRGSMPDMPGIRALANEHGWHVRLDRKYWDATLEPWKLNRLRNFHHERHLP